jgi:hypothetical protein
VTTTGHNEKGSTLCADQRANPRTARVIECALGLNHTQRAALASVADGRPAGVASTFRSLRKRGLIEDSRGPMFRGRYVLSHLGQQVFREVLSSDGSAKR